MLPPSENDDDSTKPVAESPSDFLGEPKESPHHGRNGTDCVIVRTGHPEATEDPVDVELKALEIPEGNALDDGITRDEDDKSGTDCVIVKTGHPESTEVPADVKPKASEIPESNALDDDITRDDDHSLDSPSVPADVVNESGKEMNINVGKEEISSPVPNPNSMVMHSFLLDENHVYDGTESGSEEEQSAFMKELEKFFRERAMEFKPPKFYGEGLNCLKLWRAVHRLGGYEKVTSCKLWRQVGESFRPPKTCTTVSWTFRGFYEKALLDYERQIHGAELPISIISISESITMENQGSAVGRARRDAAARAMQGWHSQRLLGNGEVSDPVMKDKNCLPVQMREKQLKNIGAFKRKKSPYMEHDVKAVRSKTSKPQLRDTTIIDIGLPADWVKINVQKTKDCYEVYALVPGLLREEVRVQSDPAGRLVISGEPEHPDNPWGVTPFKKVVSLPSRIDPHQTSAVVTLHGQLFVRVPFERQE